MVTATLLLCPGSCPLSLEQDSLLRDRCPTCRPLLCCTHWWASTSCLSDSSAKSRYATHKKRHCVTFETCATLFVNARCIYFSQFVCFVGFRSPTCLMLPTRCVWWFRKNEAWTSWRFVRFIKVFSMCEDADVRHFSQWLGPLFRNSLSLTAGIWFWTLEWEGDFPPKKALVGGAVSPKPAFWNICYHSFCNSYLSSYE